jgi:SsrA-binding protein
MKAAYKEVGYNRRAHYDYEILEKIEAGIVLCGSEVKSLRTHKVSLTDAYAGLSKSGEVFLYQMHIPEYALANRANHEPKRTRKLLLRKGQISKLIGQLKKGGFTLIPVSIYFNEKGFVKVSIGLGKGKKNIDKRETIKEREWNREKSRILKNRYYRRDCRGYQFSPIPVIAKSAKPDAATFGRFTPVPQRPNTKSRFKLTVRS